MNLDLLMSLSVLCTAPIRKGTPEANLGR